jgi:hypothetical protein
VTGCVGLIVIGMQPPNEKSVWVVGGTAGLLACGWWLLARRRFAGPPALNSLQQRSEVDVASQPRREKNIVEA